MAKQLKNVGRSLGRMTRGWAGWGSEVLAGGLSSLLDDDEEGYEDPVEVQRQDAIKGVMVEMVDGAKQLLLSNAVDGRSAVQFHHGCEHTDRVCHAMEAMLLHGLPDSLDSKAQAIWHLLTTCSPGHLTRELTLAQRHCPVGRIRAYIRDMLNTPGAARFFENQIQEEKSVKRVVKQLYKTYALLRDDEKRAQIMAVVDVLQSMIQFNLSTDHPSLRGPWPLPSRRLAEGRFASPRSVTCGPFPTPLPAPPIRQRSEESVDQSNPSHPRSPNHPRSRSDERYQSNTSLLSDDSGDAVLVERLITTVKKPRTTSKRRDKKTNRSSIDGVFGGEVVSRETSGNESSLFSTTSTVNSLAEADGTENLQRLNGDDSEDTQTLKQLDEDDFEDICAPKKAREDDFEDIYAPKKVHEDDFEDIYAPKKSHEDDFEDIYASTPVDREDDEDIAARKRPDGEDLEDASESKQPNLEGACSRDNLLKEHAVTVSSYQVRVWSESAEPQVTEVSELPHPDSGTTAAPSSSDATTSKVAAASTSGTNPNLENEEAAEQPRKLNIQVDFQHKIYADLLQHDMRQTLEKASRRLGRHMERERLRQAEEDYRRKNPVRTFFSRVMACLRKRVNIGLRRHPLEPSKLRERQQQFLEYYTSEYVMSTERQTSQSTKCAVCKMRLEEGESRLCHFSMQRCCRYCHGSKKAIIPYKIMSKFDFKTYPVCDVASEYLRNTECRVWLDDFCFQEEGQQSPFSCHTSSVICLRGRVVMWSWVMGPRAKDLIAREQQHLADITEDRTKQIRLFSVQELLLLKKNKLEKLLRKSLAKMTRHMRPEETELLIMKPNSPSS